eukprot:scaffold2068_cov226-Pinguiococcus_pyrenoidosus.AAC.3
MTSKTRKKHKAERHKGTHSALASSFTTIDAARRLPVPLHRTPDQPPSDPTGPCAQFWRALCGKVGKR